jgi:Putative 2OG-Fe(II) oxygenase
MIAHALFPTLVAEFHYDKKDDFKNRFFNRVFHHMNEHGYSMETTGNVNIHLDDELSDLFDFAASNAFQYLKTMEINDEFDLNLVKSWLNIITEFHTPYHNHQDAHLSFVYYIQIPEGMDKPVNFAIHDKPNELFHGMSNANIISWNTWNSPTWFFNPVEGQMFMFPGKLYHYTSGSGSGSPDMPVKTLDDLKPRRISIAGDFVLTYKKKIGRAYGIMPISNWKVYRQ